jgi:hypothetical protein
MADTNRNKNKNKHWKSNKKAKHEDSGDAKKKIDEGIAGVDYVQFDNGDDEEEPKKKLSNVAKKSGGFQKMGALYSHFNTQFSPLDFVSWPRLAIF